MRHLINQRNRKKSTEALHFQRMGVVQRNPHKTLMVDLSTQNRLQAALGLQSTSWLHRDSGQPNACKKDVSAKKKITSKLDIKENIFKSTIKSVPGLTWGWLSGWQPDDTAGRNTCIFLVSKHLPLGYWILWPLFQPNKELSDNGAAEDKSISRQLLMKRQNDIRLKLLHLTVSM